MNRSRLVFGPVFIVVGGLLIADQAGMVDTWSAVTRWWPTVLLLSGLIQLLTRPRNAVGGITMLTLGTALLLFTLGVIDTLALLWPVLLIALGTWLVIGRLTTARTTIDGGQVVDLVAVFDDRDVRAGPGPSRGGSLTTVFGDVRLDLSAVDAPWDPLTFQVTTLFGDVEVLTPPGWQVEVTGPEIFGDVHVPEAPAAASAPGGAPVLRLRTVLLAGDVTVRATRREVPVASDV
jgi:hypothetical protein